MWPVSDNFLNAHQFGGTPYYEAVVYEKGVQVGEALPLGDGQLTVDATAAVRRRASLTLADVVDSEGGSLIPSQIGDLLFPAGREIQLRGGFIYKDVTSQVQQTFIDNFNRANGNISGDWINAGGGDYHINANQAQNQAGGLDQICYIPSSPNVDITLKLTVVRAVTGIVARVTNSSNYIQLVSNSGAGSELMLIKTVGGANSVVADTGVTVTSGDTIRLVCDDDLYTAYKNGTLLGSWSNTEFTAGGAGIYCSDSAGRVDDFICIGIFGYPVVSELVPCGLMRINKPKSMNVKGVLGIGIDVSDRGRAVSRAKFTKPYKIFNNTPYVDAIRTLVERAFPWFTDEHFDFTDFDDTSGKMIVDVETDPWLLALSMAAAMGAELFFGPDGQCVLQPQPDPSLASPAWEYVTSLGTTLEEITSELDDETSFNGCVIIGHNTSDGNIPVRGEAWDTNPNSPTYYDPANPDLSNYGPVPFFIRSDKAFTQVRADKMAKASLLKKLGIS